jgi:hypothetical protein
MEKLCDVRLELRLLCKLRSVPVYRVWCVCSNYCRLTVCCRIRKQIQQGASHRSTSNLFPQEFVRDLTLILLMWRIGWAPNNASKWQMGISSAFKGLKTDDCRSGPSTAMRYTQRWTLPEGFKYNDNWILNLYARATNSCIQSRYVRICIQPVGKERIRRLGEYLKTYPTSDMCTNQRTNTKLSSRCKGIVIPLQGRCGPEGG